MKLLLDTNVFIPLEPLDEGDLEASTNDCAEISRLCIESATGMYLHPSSLTDIARDKYKTRRQLRERLTAKYPQLPSPPALTPNLEATLGSAKPYSNNWVDNQLIAAVYHHAIDYLVSEDGGVHRKAKRLGIADRVLTVADTLAMLRQLFDSTPRPPPAVKKIIAYELDLLDPILASLRVDYDSFDLWMEKCRKEHRACWIVEIAGLEGLAGLSITKHEKTPEHGLSGRVLKLCCFKVSEESRGYRLGELLLKSLLQFASVNKYDWIYLTAYNKHEHLLMFLEDFGFFDAGRSPKTGEVVMAKRLTPDHASPSTALDYHVRFGPPAMLISGVPTFLVPIQPRFSDILFPEISSQLDLFSGTTPCGNGIRKAYICSSNNRQLTPGNTLLFYESQRAHAVIVAGVLEQAISSRSPEEVAGKVGKRTV